MSKARGLHGSWFGMYLFAGKRMGAEAITTTNTGTKFSMYYLAG